MAASLLLLGILTSLAVARPVHGGWLAAVGVTAVLFRGLFALGWLRRALGPFADPLDLLTELGFVLLAMAFTGGARSAFAAVLFVDLLLARAVVGAAASRFLTLMTLLGLGALAGWSERGSFTDPAVAYGLAGRVLWPLGVLLAMEAALPRGAPVAAEEPPPPRAARARVPPAARPQPVPAVPEPAPPEPPAPRMAETWNGVLHDLRSPLSVIRVYTDLVAEQAQRGEPARADHIRNLRAEVELMERLLTAPPAAPPAVPAPAPGTVARVDLVRLLGRLSEAYRLAHGDRLRVEFVAERSELLVRCDPMSLQRIFRNLLDNAVKFTPPGGRVRVHLSLQGDQTVARISDTGVGMTAHEQSHAFEPAFRGRAARGTEGQGLGLGVSRELVERSGGTITLHSEEGQGSDVVVRLPLDRDSRG